MTIPKTQMAMVVEKAGELPVYKKIPVKTPDPGYLLLELKYSGVCHSDVHAMKADWDIPPKLPLVGGHEGAGVVVAVGSEVTGWEVGDHCGVKWLNSACGACRMCLTGSEQLCPNATLSGYTVDGSFQQYALTQAYAATKIPKEIDLAAASPIMCAGLTSYKALKSCGALPGQYVAVVGAGGGLGSYAVQYAKAMGFRVIAVDGGEAKGKSCMKMGAETFVDFEADGDVIDALKKVTDGEGPHAAVIVSSEQPPFERASEYVRPHGTVVILGIPGHGWLKSQVWDIVAKEMIIRGSIVGNRYDLAEALDFYKRGLINIPYQVVPMSKLHDTLNLLEHDAVIGRYVVDPKK